MRQESKQDSQTKKHTKQAQASIQPRPEQVEGEFDPFILALFMPHLSSIVPRRTPIQGIEEAGTLPDIMD